MASYRKKKKKIKKKLAAGQALTKSEIKIAVKEYGYNLLYSDMDNIVKAFNELKEEIIKIVVPHCLKVIKALAKAFDEFQTTQDKD